MAGNGPKFRIVMSRKDKQDITFVDYRGETVTKKYAPVAVLFESKLDNGGFDMKVEKRVTLDPDQFYFNVYSTDDQAGKSRPAAKPARKAPKAAAQDDGADPFAD